MIELLKRIDRKRFSIAACFYHNYRYGKSSLREMLDAIDVPLIVLQVPSQPWWAKAAKEMIRGMFFWRRSWCALLIFKIEFFWRVRPRANMLSRLLQDGGYDLLYLNNQPNSNLEGYLAGEKTGISVVQHCRIEPKINNTVCAIVNRVAYAIICVSYGVRDILLSQGIRPELCHVIHNGIDTRQTLPAVKVSGNFMSNHLVVGTIGSLIRRKSIDHILHAVTLLPANITPSVLIVGDGPDANSLRKLAHKLGLASRTMFAGFQEDPLPWLASMDIFVLPSASEGLPRVILEAMLLAKPVVASHIIGSNELVIQKKTGYLYDYGDIPSLTAYLSDLLTNKEKRETFGMAGRRRINDCFSINEYVVGVAKILDAA